MTTFINKIFNQKIHGRISSYTLTLIPARRQVLACLLEKRLPDSPGTGLGFQASHEYRCNDKGGIEKFDGPGKNCFILNTCACS